MFANIMCLHTSPKQATQDILFSLFQGPYSNYHTLKFNNVLTSINLDIVQNVILFAKV